jgi:iron complex outermembrane receptor protein
MAAGTGVDATMYGKHTVWESALFVQNEAELSTRARLTVGVRFDTHDTDVTDDRAVISPRAALVYMAADGLTFRLLGGRGFRAPSVAERFVSTTTSGFQVVPNLQLDPETAWSGELGGSWRPIPVLWIETSVFRSRFQSMIEPLIRPDGNIQFRNVTRARLSGTELAVRGSLPSGRMRFGWSYLWLTAKNLDTGEPLDYRRPKRGTLTAELVGDHWMMGIDWLYGARVERVGVYPYDRRVPLRRLDARFGIEALGARLTLHGRNLTEYAYTDIERNLSAPREWVISLERSW